jgi:hypothetical protein
MLCFPPLVTRGRESAYLSEPGNKNSGAVFKLTGKSEETTHSLSTADIKETLSLQERQWKSGIPGVDQDSKRFIFAEKFIPGRNTSNDVLHSINFLV